MSRMLIVTSIPDNWKVVLHLHFYFYQKLAAIKSYGSEPRTALTDKGADARANLSGEHIHQGLRIKAGHTRLGIADLQ